MPAATVRHGKQCAIRSPIAPPGNPTTQCSKPRSTSSNRHTFASSATCAPMPTDCFVPDRPLLDAARALMKKIHHEFKYDRQSDDGDNSGHDVLQAASRRVPGLLALHGVVPALDRIGGALRERLSGHGQATDRAPSSSAPMRRTLGCRCSCRAPAGSISTRPMTFSLGAEHVTLGWGRDFSDVTPLRGVINGGGKQTLDIKVTVEPVDSAPADLRSASE